MTSRTLLPLPAALTIRHSRLAIRSAVSVRGLLTGSALLLALVAAPAVFCQSTDPGNASEAAPSSTPGQRHGGQFAGMGRAGGEVTAIAGNTLTIKGENGHVTTIVTTDNTRVVKASGPVKVSDLHVGDGVIAMGNLDPANGTLHAAMVMASDAAELKAMRENLGKTYIVGRVTAINLDDAKMTVERSDHVAQTIGFDESTSFKRAVRGERGANGEGRGAGGMGPGMGMGMGSIASGAAMDRAFANGESITLADIKVGDSVIGTGSVKGGVFVPARLIESPPRPPRPQGNEAPGNGNAPGSGGPNAAGPTTAAPNTAATPGPGAR